MSAAEWLFVAVLAVVGLALLVAGGVERYRRAVAQADADIAAMRGKR